MCHQLSTTQNKGEENKLHQICCQWYHIIASLSWLLCKYTTQLGLQLLLRFVSMILHRCVHNTPSPIQTPILIDIHRLAVGLGIGVGECERAISENINNLLTSMTVKDMMSYYVVTHYYSNIESYFVNQVIIVVDTYLF